MRKIFLSLILFFCVCVSCYAAPCYGTKMPQKNKFFAGIQTHAIFKRYLENECGKIRSTQHLILLSFGVFDWLSIDLKGGAGNIRQRPIGSDEMNYSFNFSGGYGFRLKLYENKKLKMVFGFQHISVHPKLIHSEDKNKAVLDDWQTSYLVSYDFIKFTPYLGLKGSRVDYIHWRGENRKRVMSDLTKCLGLVLGLDLPLNEKTWLNLEGQFLDSQALAFSVNFKF